MPASAAQVAANRKNAAKSTGPKTVEGKQASRANALKHGLTATVVLLEGDAELIVRRAGAFREELKVTGVLGATLATRAAVLSVRMERGVDHEHAALLTRAQQAEADFLPPEGVDDAEADRLRERAVKLALFDRSKEASLARKYEAASERGFFRCIKELRALQRSAEVAHQAAIRRELASFSTAGMSDDEFDQLSAEMGLPPLPKPNGRPDRVDLVDLEARFDVPFAIGKRP